MLSGYLALFILAGLGAEPAEAPMPIHYFDMSYLHTLDRADPVQARNAWDTAHLVASLQGIVNRNAPRLFVRFMPEPDDFWFDYLRSGGQWLSNRPVIHLDSLELLLKTFAGDIKGVVIYDERVTATSNLASTIAGVEDRICLRYDTAPESIYGKILSSGLPFTGNAARLINTDGTPMFTGQDTIPGTDIPSTGSPKCDAHLWAKAHYLDAAKCSPEYMAYYIDAYWLKKPLESGFSNATLTNHDFFIAHRAFFFDLHVWEEEAPVDEPEQKPGTDLETLHALMRAMYQRAGGNIVHIGGFTPWAWKYTSHGNAGGTHDGVDTEWKYAKIISAYNGIMDADALGFSGMANASFYMHYPLKEHYPQNPRPTADALEQQGLLLDDGAVAPNAYVCFYMGDYDSAAWLNFHVPLWWNDPAHGSTLCTWAFNPNLDKRAPHAMDYVRTHQTENDWFMYGDSGSGYLNPGMLVAPRPESGLPDGLDAWVRHNLPYARRYDLSITGFIIDGHSKGMGSKGMDAYLQFSPDGIVGQKIPPVGVHRDTMPYLRMQMDLDGNPSEAGAKIASLAGINTPKFMFIRTILKSPSWHRETMAAAQAAASNLRFVDPYTFFFLLKAHLRAKKQSSSPPLAKVIFEAPNNKAGLVPVLVGDGPFMRGEAGGKPVLLQPKSADTRYVYFESADAFARQLGAGQGQMVRISVSLLDTNEGVLGIHYNAHPEKSYENGPEKTLTGSGAWKEAVFDLPAAKFLHTQNGGADFRLVNKGLDLALQRVAVSLAKAPRIKAFCVDFNWGPDGFAPPGMYAKAKPQHHLDWYHALGVNTIQTFCVSCPGYAWYKSEFAPVQPGMEGEFLPELVRLGHGAGMLVMGYFCIGANTHWSETHPELSHPFKSAIAIPFTTPYLDYLEKVVHEAVRKTRIDGFMIDWVYNASHLYPERAYVWLDCEKQMYQELFSEPFPGEADMDAARINEFNKRATERCWDRIRKAAKSADPNCIIWLTCYDLQHPMLAGNKMLKEVDWIMNEHPDPAKLKAARNAAGDQTRIIQCICGWGDQHDAGKIIRDPEFDEVGLYGFAKPDPETTLPLDDNSGNARNIAAMREAFHLKQTFSSTAP